MDLFRRIINYTKRWLHFFSDILWLHIHIIFIHMFIHKYTFIIVVLQMTSSLTILNAYWRTPWYT